MSFILKSQRIYEKIYFCDFSAKIRLEPTKFGLIGSPILILIYSPSVRYLTEFSKTWKKNKGGDLRVYMKRWRTSRVAVCNSHKNMDNIFQILSRLVHELEKISFGVKGGGVGGTFEYVSRISQEYGPETIISLLISLSLKYFI